MTNDDRPTPTDRIAMRMGVAGSIDHACRPGPTTERYPFAYRLDCSDDPLVRMSEVAVAVRAWAKQEGCDPADADDDVAFIVAYLIDQRHSGAEGEGA